MMKRMLAIVVLGAAMVGCGSSDEPTEAQRKLVPEAKNGGQVKAEGDKFTRVSDKN